ncbi:2OG-Fe dioxygenase family protein [Chromobacterium alticapitis]|uniref:2OG-Fe dioxygenase family protein n=1 Tax=Chromobacterium alticapitis TaxID=2073169 RepID=A0A2S5DG43_9NEIS|nr:2OG-Fe dioxygenase family protein [Chromobacterium alticapitis]POZ62053.1 hypothetical protein C2I19_10370 [Chromobacterium alticapitis]
MPATTHIEDLRQTIAALVKQQGYAHVSSNNAIRLLAEAIPGIEQHLPSYLEQWDHLPQDRFMADGGLYRYRRFNCLGAERRDGQMLFTSQPQRPFYQSTEFNTLNGGIERIYEGLDEQDLAHPVYRALLAASSRIIDALHPAPAWDIELHPIRTACAPGCAGEPTPEGIHQDGVDYFFAILIHRQNVEGGVSELQDEHHAQVWQAPLLNSMEFLLVDDRRMYHGVSSCLAANNAPGWRDALILNYRLPKGAPSRHASWQQG